jgi:hypothetical protein
MASFYTRAMQPNIALEPSAPSKNIGAAAQRAR